MKFFKWSDLEIGDRIKYKNKHAVITICEKWGNNWFRICWQEEDLYCSYCIKYAEDHNMLNIFDIVELKED